MRDRTRARFARGTSRSRSPCDRLLFLGLSSHTRHRSQETFRCAAADRRRIRQDLLVNWHDADPSELFEAIRRQAPPAEAEQLVWALERVIGGAKVDPALLNHLAVAAICM